jgi:hypothetical protein
MCVPLLFKLFFPFFFFCRCVQSKASSLLVLAAALRESEDGEKITSRYACKSTDVSHRGDVVQCHESAPGRSGGAACAVVRTLSLRSHAGAGFSSLFLHAACRFYLRHASSRPHTKNL